MILAVSAAIANEITRDVSVRPLDLRGDMGRLGAWRCVQVGKSENLEQGTAFKQAAVYENDRGVRIQAYFVTTATRLGALRDFSVALEAQGWVLHNTETVTGPMMPHLGQPMLATIEGFTRDGKELLALGWFVSSRQQAPDLRHAEIRGWRDLLTQMQPPLWAEFYATIEVGNSTDEARKALLDFGREAGLKLADLVSKGARVEQTVVQ